MSSDLVWAVVRLLVSLPLVLGLAYLVLRYGLTRRYAAPSGHRRMKLVEQLPLGPKATLSLVALGERYYLLAQQDQSIQLIKELGALPEPVDRKIGDIVEFTPQTLEEFDQLPNPGTSVETGSLSEILKGRGRTALQTLAGRFGKALEVVRARSFPGNRLDEKGEKKVEG